MFEKLAKFQLVWPNSFRQAKYFLKKNVMAKIHFLLVFFLFVLPRRSISFSTLHLGPHDTPSPIHFFDNHSVNVKYNNYCANTVGLSNTILYTSAVTCTPHHSEKTVS